MIYKTSKIVLIFLILISFIWGFSDSYSSHTIDNIVHVVAIGIDKCNDDYNNMKVSFQFVNLSNEEEGSSSGKASTIVTSITTTTINKAINLMNSYIGRELNFSHCKVIVFSKEFAQDGISTEICTLTNNEEIRPSTNIVVSTSDANSYLKNSNPNIEKLVTNYYETFELTSNFTGYSDDTTIGNFYNNMFSFSSANTAILGRTFQKVSSSPDSLENNSQENNNSSSDNENSYFLQDGSSGISSGGNNQQNDSGGASLEISGQRGTQNVGIAVFKDAKYIGQLSEMDSICHLLITNNVDSFVLSIPIDGYPDNLLDLNVSSVRSPKINVDTSSDSPKISISVYCEAKILTADQTSNYDSDNLKILSKESENFLKQQIKVYLDKTSKDFKSDIANFSAKATSNFLTSNDWKNYDWISKYENSNFDINVDFDITSSLLFSNNH